MISTKLHASSVAVALSAASASALATTLGPDWDELVDAGATPATAQRLFGQGSIASISGQLALSVAGDDEDQQDMYLVWIAQPTVIAFSASTDAMRGGGADFDTRLWLFDAAGFGLLANDDADRNLPQSTLLDASTDGTNIVITKPGLYFLAVSGTGTEPVSGDDDARGPLFLLASPTEISGPDGPGGEEQLDEWTRNGAPGAYVIALTGVAFLTPGDLDGDGVVGPADLATLLANWGPCVQGQPCIADVAPTAAEGGDGIVGPGDLAILLANWG